MSDSEIDAASLAADIHEFYRAEARQKGWTLRFDVPFSELPEELKQDNLAAAARLPEILAAAGLGVTGGAARDAETIDQDTAAAMVESVIEVAAELEHVGWMETKAAAGWRYAEERSDEAKEHPSMVDYDKLSEQEKDKDRSAARNYVKIVARAGLEFVAI